MRTLLRLDDDTATGRDAFAAPGHSNRIILASNRGPLEYHFDERGRLEGSGGNGGVATALTSLVPLGDFVWIASAMTDGDRAMARAGTLPRTDRRPLLPAALCRASTSERIVATTASSAILCSGSCNIRSGTRCGDADLAAQIRRSWEEGYLPANRAFARAVVDEVEERRWASVRHDPGLSPLHVPGLRPPDGAGRHPPAFPAHPVAGAGGVVEVAARDSGGDLRQPLERRRGRIPDRRFRGQLRPDLSPFPAGCGGERYRRRHRAKRPADAGQDVSRLGGRRPAAQPDAVARVRAIPKAFARDSGQAARSSGSTGWTPARTYWAAWTPSSCCSVAIRSSPAR